MKREVLRALSAVDYIADIIEHAVSFESAYEEIMEHYTILGKLIENIMSMKVDFDAVLKLIELMESMEKLGEKVKTKFGDEFPEDSIELSDSQMARWVKLTSNQKSHMN